MSYKSTDRTEMGSVEMDRLSKLTADNIQKIQGNVNQMQTILSQIGTSSDSNKLRDDLKQIQQHGSNLVKETNDQIKLLQNLPSSSNIDEQRLWRIKKDRLVNEFTRVLTSFQEMQRKEKEKTKIPLPKATPNFFDEDERPPRDQQLALSQTQAQVNTTDLDMITIRENEAEMKRLESDITDVNQIFKDLASIIHEQGDVIDSIEENTDHAAQNVESGVEQLRRARAHQTSARKKKLCCAIVLIVAIIIIVIILAVTIPTKN